MTIVDIDKIQVVEDVCQLEVFLQRRHRENMNVFYLSDGIESYPLLMILVNGDLTALHYHREEFDVGYKSIGHVPGLIPNETTLFSISMHPADDIVERNDSIVPFVTALTAAKEFYLSKNQPSSIEWSQM